MWTNLNTAVVDSFTVLENTNSYTVTGLSDTDNYNVSVVIIGLCGMMTSDLITVYGMYVSVRIDAKQVTCSLFMYISKDSSIMHHTSWNLINLRIYTSTEKLLTEDTIYCSSQVFLRSKAIPKIFHEISIIPLPF